MLQTVFFYIIGYLSELKKDKILRYLFNLENFKTNKEVDKSF